uniref:Uncharacterized protein n=1 Tax=Rhizophora mucronata TaxID=61149 RepID=A0A2P2NZJ9_RHIMU
MTCQAQSHQVWATAKVFRYWPWQTTSSREHCRRHLDSFQNCTRLPFTTTLSKAPFLHLFSFSETSKLSIFLTIGLLEVFFLFWVQIL